MGIAKTIIKFLLHDNWIVLPFRNKFFSNVFLAIASLYFLCFELFREEWPFFVKWPDVTLDLFFLFAFLVILTACVRGYADWYVEVQHKEKIGLKEDLIYLASKLVMMKLYRFKDKAKSITKTGNAFKKITHPTDQVKQLLTDFVNILRERFNLKEDEVCITIMYADKPEGIDLDEMPFCHPIDWNHTEPSIILSENSAATACLERGEPIFIADKQKAAEEDNYFLSTRDERKSGGSIYCYPSHTYIGEDKFSYVISISSYGKRICDANNAEQIDAIKVIFNEICRRIDIELTLKSIKDWQK